MSSVTQVLGALVLLLRYTTAHYFFSMLQINSTVPKTWDYIRPQPEGNRPLLDLSSLDIRCGLNASQGSTTVTAPVTAGNYVTWLAQPIVYHPGPVSVFMSAVSEAATATGAGDWFKIMDIGPTLTPRGGDWSNILQERFDVEIPPCLPEGEYLLRIQQAAVHRPGRTPQMHVSCAQLRVRRRPEKSGKPGTSRLPGSAAMIKIPGPELGPHVRGFTQNIFVNFRTYEIPGGKVWTCEQ